MDKGENVHGHARKKRTSVVFELFCCAHVVCSEVLLCPPHPPPATAVGWARLRWGGTRSIRGVGVFGFQACAAQAYEGMCI